MYKRRLSKTNLIFLKIYIFLVYSYMWVHKYKTLCIKYTRLLNTIYKTRKINEISPLQCEELVFVSTGWQFFRLYGDIRCVSGQAHLNPPLWLMQRWEQLPFFSSHSLTSGKYQKERTLNSKNSSQRITSCVYMHASVCAGRVCLFVCWPSQWCPLGSSLYPRGQIHL